MITEQDIDYVRQDLYTETEALREQITTLQEQVAELQKPEEPPQPDGRVSEDEANQLWFAGLPDWSATAQYVDGQIVKHNGKVWRALPDVANFAPDETYDLDADPQTGGWALFEY